MKAILCFKYGLQEVLQFKEVEKPSPKENDVHIKVIATTVNRTECGFRDVEYFVVRLGSGLLLN